MFDHPMKRHFRELSVALALGVLLLFLAVAAPAFYQPQPLLSLLTREAPTLVVACGMALVIIGRQIDISVGSQFAVCSVCAGLLAVMNLPFIRCAPVRHVQGGLDRAPVHARRGADRRERWRRESKHSDKWKLCDTNPGLRPEKAG